MNRIERIGVGLSLACAIHCIVTPLLIGLLPLLGHQLAEAHWLEGLLIGLVAVIGYGTLTVGFRRHRRILPLLAFSAGLGVAMAGHSLLPHEAELPASVAGALILAGAQFWNARCPVACCSRAR